MAPVFVVGLEQLEEEARMQRQKWKIWKWGLRLGQGEYR